jgi:hypothetical protein
MNKAPKKIWVDFVDWPDSPPLICSIKPDVHSWNGEPYIRADLFDELVEALEITAELVEALGHTAKKARAALAKIKEKI